MHVKVQQLRQAFTLVELVVALAIASMLMTAIAGILIVSHRQLNMVVDESYDRWHSTMTSIIRHDLLQASHVHQENGWVWLTGEFQSHGNTDPVSRVGYGIVPWVVDGQTALMRFCGSEGQPLIVGPNRLVIERLDNLGTPQPLSAQPTPISEQLRMWIWQAGSPEPVLTRDLVVY